MTEGMTLNIVTLLIQIHNKGTSTRYSVSLLFLKKILQHTLIDNLQIYVKMFITLIERLD